MKKISKSLLLPAILSVVVSHSYGRENIGMPVHRIADSHRVEANDCRAATSQIDLNVNNVRARLMNGGDMWWDLVASARYEVPKVPADSKITPVSSLFAGAIWVGGIDQGGQLKVAAQTYRQNGNDYFPGPLDENGETSSDICSKWDKQWQVFATDIDTRDGNASDAGKDFTKGDVISESLVPQNMLQWPAKGNPYNTIAGNRNMAPFADVDGDGIYDPTKGDYPIIGEIERIFNHQKTVCNSNTFADQMIWWVYNDKGNLHSESGAQAIGLEVHTLAFAFKTNDEIDDMTFYRYLLFNKATSELDTTYMGQWADPDLGCAFDDYVGCDSARSLGIVYNATQVDGGSGCSAVYGKQPPLIGIDYFKGPFDYSHGPNKDTVELGVTSFLYYNNDFSPQGNPINASSYYGYLRGYWIDGSHFTRGGDAHGGSINTNYVFPDQPNNAAGWSEYTQNDPVTQDKRIIQASGPFTLLPGATNEIIIGAVWVRPPIGNFPVSFNTLQRADDKAQALFDNCFKILDGPNAPDVKTVELDRKVVLSFVNTNSPKTELYRDFDPILVALNVKDPYYNFEGYQVFQLASPTVSVQELSDPTKARLVAQCDIKNEASKLINYDYDASLSAEVPVLKVEGTNDGIKHSFQFTDDLFASGDKRMVNFKKYYYTVLSYAYNGSTDTITNNTNHTITYVMKKPYLAGRRNIKTYTVIPHKPSPGGNVLNSDYGSGPIITRQEGTGNDANWVDLTQQSIDEILANKFTYHPSFLGGAGPVKIKVVDPKSVPSGNFELKIIDTLPPNGEVNVGNLKAMLGTSFWQLTNLTTNTTIFSDQTIQVGNEQIIPDWGLSVYVKQVRNPGSNSADDNNGFLGATITYSNPSVQWLSGFADQDGETPFNWIRSGTNWFSDKNKTNYEDTKNLDDIEAYENILGRSWAPYRMCGASGQQRNYLYTAFSPAWWNTLAQGKDKMDSLISIDVVFTPDKSKWTHCIVVESNTDKNLAQGGVEKCAMRRHRSLNIDGNYSTDPNDNGFSWFPGYAINPENGRRLNILFAEDSWDVENNGGDMIWNPTFNIVNSHGQLSLGGRHFIYIMRSKYDEDQMYKSGLTPSVSNDPNANGNLPSDASSVNVYKDVAWVDFPIVSPQFELTSFNDGIIPTETTVKIRVAKDYEKYNTDVNENNSFPRYTFSTDNIATVHDDGEVAKTALDTINIVPNPYYAYSTYETNQLDNRVKITNLPPKCEISIYALDGTLVRKITRDDNTNTYTDWDLKNNVGVPIASGVYIIHINADGIGERVMKWFGIIRPVDLDSF